jgi:hypothetical protein
MIAAFEQPHVVPALAEPHPRREPGKTASDYHHALWHYFLSLLFNQMLMRFEPAI